MADFPSVGQYTIAKAFPSASSGVSIDPGGSINTKGPYFTVASGTTFCVNYLTINKETTLRNQQTLFDISIGAPGSEQVVLGNLHHANGSETLLAGLYSIPIPITIPISTRIAARCQSSVASANTVISLITFGGGFLSPPAPHFTRTYGADPSDSGGTQVDPGAVVGDKGVYSVLSSATVAPINWMALFIGNQANTAPATARFRLDISIGNSGSELPIVENLVFGSIAAANGIFPGAFSFPVCIPSSVRVSARASSTIADATDRLFDVVAVGIT